MDKIKALDINDIGSIRIDNSGVTDAYFALTKPVAINKKTIKDLKQLAVRENCDLRICLHEDSNNLFHDMVIVQNSGNFHPPHKHPTKPESYHLIEGELGAIHFDEAGNIMKTCILQTENNFIYRVDSGEYHVVFPISEWVVYHESKPGPFTRKEDFIEPEWGPDKNDEQAILKYNNMIHNVFKR